MTEHSEQHDELATLGRKLVGVPELARAVHRHPDTIRRWGRLEGMPYHAPGGKNSRWLIDVDDFRAWFRNRCFANGTPPEDAS
jgi:hypothetical protein